MTRMDISPQPTHPPSADHTFLPYCYSAASRLRVMLLLVPFIATCAGPDAQTATADTEWIHLFDGETLAGWSNPYDWGEAWVEDGEIHLRADRKFFIVSDESFRDFVFE